MQSMRTIVAVCLLAAICEPVCKAAAPGPFLLRSPVSGSTISTPLSGKIAWFGSARASSYRLTLRSEGSTVFSVSGLQSTTYRVALRPQTTYEWSVSAVNSDGETLATNAPYTLITPTVVPQEVTDPLVLFSGWHSGTRFCNIDPLPVDPDAVVSPWYYKKQYDQSPPPTYDQVKGNLPVPIWDGHQDALDMYWYAWKTLFSTWVYPPASGSKLAVSNMLGMPTWAGWGSTMVWDSAFMLQFARYASRGYPVITALDNCYARQHENGLICRESDNLNNEVDSTWPVNLPLLAWAEWSNYNVTGDADRLNKVFLPLVKQYEWTMLYQRRASGLYWNMGMGDGMDDSPRNDLAHSYVTVSSAMAMSADILGQMAQVAGRNDLAGWFSGEYNDLKNLVNANFWDSTYNIYNDLGTDGKPITNTSNGNICKHVGDFWPMIAGVVPPGRAAYLANQLADTKSFNRPSGTASLSADSNGYNNDSGGYWRGAVWPPTQYMVIKGLEQCGNETLANRLANKYFGALLTAYKSRGDITEYISPEKPVMYGCDHFVGWGGLGPIAMLFEDIFGIRVAAPTNTITWRITKTERHGIQNLYFAGHLVSLVCGARNSAADPCSITIDSDGPFELVLNVPAGIVQKHIPTGHSEFQIESGGQARSATSFYVSTTGSDTNDGKSPDTAWASIDKGDQDSILIPGDTVNVLPGTYTPPSGVAISTCSGDSGKPITYRALGNVTLARGAVSGPALAISGPAGHIVFDGFHVTGGSVVLKMQYTSWNEVRNCWLSDRTGGGNSPGLWLVGCGNNVIHHNIIGPNLPPYTHGICEDACLGGDRILNNTIVGTTDKALQIGGGTGTVPNIEFRNNIIYQATHGINSETPSLVHSNNILCQVSGTLYNGTSEGPNESTADPQFVNGSALSYALAAGSPAIDAGIDVGLSFNGSAPDLGAIESARDLPSASSLPLGSYFSLPEKPITAAGDGLVFIEEPGRFRGVKIRWSGPLPDQAKMVLVTGRYAGIVDNEPTIDAGALDAGSVGAVSPVGMRNGFVGWPGLERYSGLDTRCLLVKTWGKVTYQGDGYFLLDDGSGLTDYLAPTGQKGIKVILPPEADMPGPGDMVVVTGVDRASTDGTRWIMPRTASDIQ